MYFTFASHMGQRSATVVATEEKEARRLAMVELWGAGPSPVVPYAPAYEGTGLILTSQGE